MSPGRLDAVVVGAGPNGLAAALTLARAGRSVTVLEGEAAPGGGCSTRELTHPGYLHDVCSAVHPLAAASPFMQSLGGELGDLLIQPPLPLVHVGRHGHSVPLQRSVAATAAGLGRDGDAYRTLMEPLVAAAPRLLDDLLQPPLHLPRHPATLARLLPRAAPPTGLLLRAAFRGGAARALLAGAAGHAMQPLSRTPSALPLLLLMLGHSHGWPIIRGGSGALSALLVRHLEAAGGTVECGHPVRGWSDLPSARVVLFDTDVGQMAAIAGDRLPAGYRERLARIGRGPGVFKLDYALSGPVPWHETAWAAAGTLHLGGSARDVDTALRQVVAGRLPDRPFVLVSQPTLFDAGRAPSGRHTLWAYCHVPNGSDADMTAPVERVIEEAAPGFRGLVLDRHAMTAHRLQRHNPNYVGGDIGLGPQTPLRILVRPVARITPYATPNPAIWICSAACPPGPGVHGMAGHNAARQLLRSGASLG